MILVYLSISEKIRFYCNCVDRCVKDCFWAIKQLPSLTYWITCQSITAEHQIVLISNILRMIFVRIMGTTQGELFLVKNRIKTYRIFHFWTRMKNGPFLFSCHHFFYSHEIIEKANSAILSIGNIIMIWKEVFAKKYSDVKHWYTILRPWAFFQFTLVQKGKKLSTFCQKTPMDLVQYFQTPFTLYIRNSSLFFINYPGKAIEKQYRNETS